MSKDKEEKIGAAVGAGTAATAIGVAAAGTSASGIVGGLASAGAIVGGGMAAGVAVTAAAPILAAGLGYAAVKGIKSLLK